MELCGQKLEGKKPLSDKQMSSTASSTGSRPITTKAEVEEGENLE